MYFVKTLDGACVEIGKSDAELLALPTEPEQRIQLLTLHPVPGPASAALGIIVVLEVLADVSDIFTYSHL
jgi:hypothetical protein